MVVFLRVVLCRVLVVVVDSFLLFGSGVMMAGGCSVGFVGVVAEEFRVFVLFNFPLCLGNFLGVVILVGMSNVRSDESECI